ncbi:hypothetical protein AB205_0121210 [Aquarana catesbeiana]|uniref:Uncharacterized protein n=1 Tax=Aquarana catesbeiana TaxID=8400 RepID=A0A2G9S2Q4_AQUCT|nr:hypothetical protein AB205_0121210 [Aquarana catesbeiana]
MNHHTKSTACQNLQICLKINYLNGPNLCPIVHPSFLTTPHLALYQIEIHLHHTLTLQILTLLQTLV